MYIAFSQLMARAWCELLININFKNSIWLRKIRDHQVLLLLRKSDEYPHLILEQLTKTYPKIIHMPLTQKGDLWCYSLVPPPVWETEDWAMHTFRASPFVPGILVNIYGYKFTRFWTMVSFQEWLISIQLHVHHIRHTNIIPLLSLLFSSVHTFCRWTQVVRVALRGWVFFQ